MATRSKHMPVIVQLEWPGLTAEQFERARKIVGWEDRPAAGSIVQAQGWYNGSFRATDIWESEAAWNNFLETRILPHKDEIGISGEPKIEIFEAASVFMPDRQPTRV